jgi:Kef-type K+ transport system membrane component KefB/nucleotide-binding universal stress UspA family protein
MSAIPWPYRGYYPPPTPIARALYGSEIAATKNSPRTEALTGGTTMLDDSIELLSGQAILILLLQLAVLLVLARLLAELMRRIGQPAVIGELLAGVFLGPTVLGHLFPELFAWAFPQEAAQFHLLEAVSWLGMVLLLLLTGLETDIRIMKNLGRAALSASVFGMVIPFASGLLLGWYLPDRFLADPADRNIFAAFLATAMAISAMPVIAKILMDLKLMRRDVGMVILSAGVVDDTTGWLLLSIIAGIAAGGAFEPGALGQTLLWLAVFLAAMRWILYPGMNRLVGYINERVGLAGADLTLILGFTFLAAATTEAIGIHAVFGAFLAGIVVRQIRRVRTSSLHSLELFVLSALSPIFFAFAGLKVNLWDLSGWELPVLVFGVAVGGKIAGCYVGGRLGRMSHWESLAVGFGMNARGAMGLIVALIGLSLGLLTQELYSVIVLVAMATSLMAPLLLQWAVPHLPLSDEERRRIEDSGQVPLLPRGSVRILVPTAGGQNAMAALRLAGPLARARGGQVTALYVESGHPGEAKKRRWLPRRPSLAGTNMETHLRQAAQVVGEGTGRLLTRKVSRPDVAGAVLEEARRDYDLMMIGAAGDTPLHDPLTQRILKDSPVPVVIVRRSSEPLPATAVRLLVPFDGSLFSRYAAEFAFAFAAAAKGHVTVLHVVDEARITSSSLPVTERRVAQTADPLEAADLELQLRLALGAAAARHGATFSTRIVTGGSPGETIVSESRSDYHDLLVLGAENKLLGAALFFGQGTAEILERAGCTTSVVVPRFD